MNSATRNVAVFSQGGFSHTVHGARVTITHGEWVGREYRSAHTWVVDVRPGHRHLAADSVAGNLVSLIRMRVLRDEAVSLRDICRDVERSADAALGCWLTAVSS